MALLAIAALSGCGGHDTFSPELVSSRAVTISILPQNPNVEYPGNVQLTATVTGSSNTGVNWTILGDPSNPGTLSNTGLYTPGTNSGGSIVVQAQSQADPSKTATTTITVFVG
jgi:hypothetical protein